MDDHTTMFGSIEETNLDFVVMDEISSDSDLSFSTLLNFSSSYLNSADEYMKPLDDHLEFFNDRLIQAIEYLNEQRRTETDLLVQLWLPVIKHGKRVLITDNIPFMNNSDSLILSNYREFSKIHQFAAEYDSTEMIGLPGRVFLKNFPACTPDLRYMAEGDDPRVNYAQELDLCGCLNLPIFEIDGGDCLGVMEVVTTSQRVNFRDELENISKALEAVDLRSSEFLIHPKLKDFSEPYDIVLAEIRDFLKSVCETLNLPLAQTWARSQPSVASISVVGSASYVFDPKVLGFYEASSVQKLVQGEGTAGKALGTNQQCFTNINDFCRADYPLAHEARIFGLNGAIAIRLRSTYTVPTDFILEFFLPRDCIGEEEQRQIRTSIDSMIRCFSWSLHAINDDELPHTRDESWISRMVEAQQRGENVIVSMGCYKEEPEEEFKMINEIYNGLGFSNPEKESYLGWASRSRSRSTVKKQSSEKSRSKTERNISLQVLQQYFPGSLKDAAKSIGVCPTTLKRICRQHGIMRWPSRKIKKVSHSLKKLQLVIDSVQGVEGTINLESFYTNFPDLTSPVTPRPKPTVNNRVNLLKSQTTPTNSSSSGSQGSISSLRCSTGTAGRSNHSSVRLDTIPLDKNVDEVIMPPRESGGPILLDECVFRVKATYGEEKIRFRMSKNWGFGDLRHEIMRRFNIHDMGNITFEYIDDESEWVLLACDADLEECMDLHLSTKNQTIRLFLYRSLRPSFVSTDSLNDDIQYCV